MLELGKPGSTGTKGETPVLRDGVVVATLRASSWKEAATAVVGGREWIFTRRKGELTARRGVDPEHAVRFRARQTSWWKGSWAVDLEGSSVEVEKASMWKGTHRYSSGGRPVAESGSTGGWSPRPTLAVHGDLTDDQQVFLLWLELVVSRRHQAAMTAGIGAAVVGGSS
ncbi:hypothetical protein OF117_10330 [Geodermatophilus sp. YIM 151500]|uniref:hypothetical protein n=1 Tax=Geodermatophilus sp. YIM 151500 TaxID=2984531 RepID=UPI0021E4F1BB|nr:hypothetical protein [Geodermatophilus sp. YIM 151500]MCV2489758.1 hypothetical protein [Geodermatophilus sp. YIM 151500]